MSIQSQRELENSQEKLRRLQEHYEARKQEPSSNPRLREISLQSLKRTINRLKEEIIRFQAHARTKS